MTDNETLDEDNFNRIMALEEVRSSAQKLKSDFLGQMETRLATMMDDIVDSLQKTELPRKFMISDPVMMKDKRKASEAGKLPEKVFRSRPSPLTELLEVPHFKTIHHIFIATLALIMLHTMILDLLKTGTFDLGLERLMWGFGHPQTALSILFPLEFCSLVVIYPAFYFWSTQRLNHKADTTRVIDRLAASSFLVFMIGVIYFPASILWKNPLPPASGAAVTMEQCRLLMKMYAFVRSNVPRALKFERNLRAAKSLTKKEHEEIGYDVKNIEKSKKGSIDGAVIPTATTDTAESPSIATNTSNGNCSSSIWSNEDANEKDSSSGSLRKRDGHCGSKEEKDTANLSGNLQRGNEVNQQNRERIQRRQLQSRSSWISWDDEKSPCPDFSKYLYFFFAPTLIYKDSYPRTSRVRWDYVCWNFAQVIGCIVYGSFILGRFCSPYFGNFGHPNHPMTVPQLLDALFSLMLPGILGLVLGFFLLLHAWHNAWAEMLGFGDRLFYKDWWNQASFASYYKTWNVLVHDWLYTYIFKDAWDSGLGKKVKALPTILVFLVSSLFHEYIISFSFHFFFPVLLILFGGFGLPLVFLKNPNNAVGNVFMWMSLIAGTGICVSAYTMEFFARINCPVIELAHSSPVRDIVSVVYTLKYFWR